MSELERTTSADIARAEWDALRAENERLKAVAERADAEYERGFNVGYKEGGDKEETLRAENEKLKAALRKIRDIAPMEDSTEDWLAYNIARAALNETQEQG